MSSASLSACSFPVTLALVCITKCVLTVCVNSDAFYALKTFSPVFHNDAFSAAETYSSSPLCVCVCVCFPNFLSKLFICMFIEDGALVKAMFGVDFLV